VPHLPRLDVDVRPTDLLALYAATTLDRFIDQTFHLLPRAVRCDYVSAFYQRVGDGFLKERDSRGRTWGRAFMRRYLELTPAVPLVIANPGVKILATRFALTPSDGELHRTPFYREVMQRQGWRHGAVLCFWAAPFASFPIFVLTLYRTEGHPDFTDHDLRLLENLHAFLAPAVTRFHDISASEAVSAGVATVLRHVSPGIVVLDWQLRTVRTTLAGRRACAQWNGISASRSTPVPRSSLSLPDCLLAVCNELRRELTSVMRRDRESNTQRRRAVSHPDAPALSASVTVVWLATPLSEPSFVIEFDGSGQSPAPSAETASLLAKLTKSESDVALVVAEGLSNEEAAERLGKTLHAVKFLLHRVYRKLGVANRARLSLLLREGPRPRVTDGLSRPSAFGCKPLAESYRDRRRAD
jgi:DNA-binding NarL/FixJ family response regulator